jgi:hypothetical protein
MQYAKARQSHSQVHSGFLHSVASHLKYKCTSLKICENRTLRLRIFLHHAEVTSELWDEIRQIRGDIGLVETDQLRRNAYMYPITPFYPWCRILTYFI